MNRAPRSLNRKEMRRENADRETVLNRIRHALMDARGDSQGIDMVSNVFQPYGSDTEVVFAEALTANGGDFIYCSDEAEFLASLALYLEERKISSLGCVDPDLRELLSEESISLDEDPENPVASITTAELLVARTGSIIVSTARHEARPFVYPEIHIVLAFASQVRPDLHPAMRSITQKYQGKLPPLLTVISGSSRTADIEKRLVIGVHGPKQVAVFMIDDKSAYA